MGELVNMKQFRKRRERSHKAQEADTNRALFGRTKAEKRRDEQSAESQKAALDGHRLDDGKPS